MTEMIINHGSDKVRFVIPVCVLYTFSMFGTRVDLFERLDAEGVQVDAKPQLRID